MIAFYAMGSGWGHLTRIQTFIENQGIEPPYQVITSNEQVGSFFDKPSILFIPADEHSTKEGLATQLKAALKSFQFTACYVDVFPCGILGELNAEWIPTDRFHYLGRRVTWDQYLPLVEEPIAFDTAYLFEQLEESHFRFVQQQSQKVEHVELRYPPPIDSFTHPLLTQGQPIWLIVHTSNPEEVKLLLDHAQDIAMIEQVEPQLVVLTNESFERQGVHCLTDQNPINWYPHASKIFSAGGFNTWHQLAPWRSKHTCLPFPRRFDDQFWRAVRNSSNLEAF